jgi:hypothetical protein
MEKWDSERGKFMSGSCVLNELIYMCGIGCQSGVLSSGVDLTKGAPSIRDRSSLAARTVAHRLLNGSYKGDSRTLGARLYNTNQCAVNA